MATPEYLERAVAICRRHGILLAYDNAYCDLTFDGYRAPSIFEIPGADEVALEFFSLSKSFSMTGWRLGLATGRAELIGALTRVKSYVDTGPFLAVQKAGAAVLCNAPGALAATAGRFNTEAEIDYAAQRVVEEVSRLRQINPAYRAKQASEGSARMVKLPDSAA